LLDQYRKMIRRTTVDTTSLDASHAWQAAAPVAADACLAGSGVSASLQVLEQLEPRKRLLLKLLHIEDFDLDADDLQILALRGGCSVLEVAQRVEQAREQVRGREVMRQRKSDAAEAVGDWILLYQRRVASLDERLRGLPGDCGEAARLRVKREELVRKLDWRRRQLAERLHKSKRARVSAPTKLVAQLLNQPEGTVRSEVTRVRREIEALIALDAGLRRSERDASA